MPEQMIAKIKKSILPVWKVCFLSALIMGLVAHVYKITNWLPNWDSLVFRYDPQNMIALGRWFLPVVCAPSTFYDLPFIAGLMAILLHSLGAVCICKLFDVKKNITAALIGAVVATFPTVTSVMLYNYVADGYALAFFFSCLAAVLLTKEKPRYAWAILLIALSSGIYQAYITVTIVLLLISLIFELLYQKKAFKHTIFKAFKFLVAGTLGMVLYYLVLTALLKLTGGALLAYQGMDGAVSFEGLDIAGSLYTAKESFVKYFFDFSSGFSVFTAMNCIIFALIFVLYPIDMIKHKVGISKTLMFFICVLLLPFGASVLSFINSHIDYHNLMKMGFVGFYLLLILQYEKADFKHKKLNFAKSWLVLCLSAVLVFNQVIIAGVSYHKLGLAYEKSYGTLIRIADRIEQTEGANACDSVLVLGRLAGSEAYSVKLPPDITGTTDGYILRADDEVVGQSVLCSALNDYCGKNYRFLAGDEKRALLAKTDVEGLENWPEKTAISVVDNVIIIKLSDER